MIDKIELLRTQLAEFRVLLELVDDFKLCEDGKTTLRRLLNKAIKQKETRIEYHKKRLLKL